MSNQRNERSDKSIQVFSIILCARHNLRVFDLLLIFTCKTSLRSLNFQLNSQYILLVVHLPMQQAVMQVEFNVSIEML